MPELPEVETVVRDVRPLLSGRHFVSVRAGPHKLRKAWAAGLGPEPFDLEPVSWRKRLSATRRSLKATLLDQGVVAGVGNIYADEALFEARLHPARRADSLSPAEAERLRQDVAAVLTRAI